MSVTAEEWIERLRLEPHPEGGFFRETYRDPEQLQTERGQRSAATHIYFLLRFGECSHLHRIHYEVFWDPHLFQPDCWPFLRQSTESEPNCLHQTSVSSHLICVQSLSQYFTTEQAKVSA